MEHIRNRLNGNVLLVEGTPITPDISTKQPKKNIEITALDKLLENYSKKPDYSKYALIIGIENYSQHVNVNYAKNSARSFSLTGKFFWPGRRTTGVCLRAS